MPRSPKPVPEPQDREVVVRRTARVIMIDPEQRVLLFADSDPNLPEFSWWVTPGGGIDPGETPAQAAVREVAEETGARITESELIGPVVHRHVVHGYSDQIVDIDEVFYAVRIDGFEVDIAGHTLEEQLTLTGHRWWPRAELGATDAWIWPAGLPALVDRVLVGDHVLVEWGEQQESTLAVDAR